MIRSAMPDDMTALIALADATGLFEPNQLEELSEMLSDYFDSSSTGDSSRDSKAERFWLIDDDKLIDNNNAAVGVAYCEMERMTDRTWNLQLIAIRPDRQGQGRGTKLLHYVEQTLAERSGRVLLVETSGTPEFDRTRAFYRKCGYHEEARIRDFYTAGADKLVFCKVLSEG